MSKKLTRPEILAEYILKYRCTIRFTAKAFEIPKSTVHNDVSNKLKKINYKLYEKVSKILDENFSIKHFRGGEATKKRWKQLNFANKK